MSGTRTNAYYLRRLAAHHPQVYADYLAGKHKTVKAARRAANMLSERTPLHELKNAWRKASPVEQRAFVDWLKSLAGALVAHSIPQPVDPDGKLTTPAARRIDQIMAKRSITMGKVMKEMGFNPRDQSVATAIARGTKIRPAVAAALESWLKSNARF